ncbi:MAG: redoxin domain-containing protein [Acidobacteria bacterium]|nr:redoxin domain-containing protein [Acidobacteriota bacterium]
MTRPTCHPSSRAAGVSGSPRPQPWRPKPRSSAALLVAALVLGALAVPPAGAENVSDLVMRYGLKPVTPPAAASQFTLTNLAGGETSLSDFRGSWVLLTFWATWCGPCRSEMPSLEKLHQTRGGKGLEIVGVSVDNSRVPVDPYIEKMGLTFTMLWDGRGSAATAYHASSIPLTYLIDPEGKVVAISRGARDWNALTPMLDAVTSIEAPADGSGIDYAADQGPVQLPEVLDPPTADLSLSTDTPAVGEPFELTVKLRWAGNFEEYLPQPPQVSLPEGVEQRSMSAETSSQDGKNLVTYTITLAAAEPGSYALDPVELRYTPRYGQEPVSSRIAGPTVTVEERTWAGLTKSELLWTGGGVAVGGLALGLVLAGWRKRRGARREEPGLETSLAALRQRLEAARAARLSGDARTAALELAGLELELLGGSDPAAEARLHDILEGARYGGRTPPGPELDRMERRVERRLAELRPDPEQEERAALQLREQSRGGRGRPTISEETR